MKVFCGYAVQTIAEDDQEPKYLAYESGWGPILTPLNGAKLFNSELEAEKSLKSEYFTKRTKMSDGSLNAPYILRLAGKINSSKRRNNVTVSIVKIFHEIEVVKQKNLVVYDIVPTSSDDHKYEDGIF